jgi:hypothetical protein
MIQKTSAVTTTVLGEVKIVGLLVLSAMLLGEGKEFTVKMTVGCLLAMGGFALYRCGASTHCGAPACTRALPASSFACASASPHPSAPCPLCSTATPK